MHPGGAAVGAIMITLMIGAADAIGLPRPILTELPKAANRVSSSYS